MTDAITPTLSLIDRTTEIVSAYVMRNTLEVSALPDLIRTVHTALSGIDAAPAPGPSPAPVSEKAATPAVAIDKSITPDYLICFENGKKYRSLQRHLADRYNMTPEDYREKWGLPPDYPMVAPNHSAARTLLAEAPDPGARAYGRQGSEAGAGQDGAEPQRAAQRGRDRSKARGARGDQGAPGDRSGHTVQVRAGVA